MGQVTASGALLQELVGGIHVGDLKGTLLEIMNSWLTKFRDCLAWERAMAISKPTVQFRSHKPVWRLMKQLVV
jgi:hypothetical protein